MDTEQVKRGLQVLIDDFKAKREFYIKNSEATTESRLIENLFKLLGWTENDWIKQEKTIRGKKTGRADYSFYLGEKRVFYLEVKKVGIPLEKEADKQVISYALPNRIPIAVSTNFEELKIFCVEQENATTQIFRVFKKPEDYITNIQNLMLLSKESFENNLILQEAENEGRLKKRISINKILLDDLMHIRKFIVDDIEKNYPNEYELNHREEIVQRIIDRLIFIRRCEDISINPENIYLDEITHLSDSRAYSRLKEFFEKYNAVYNSGLFAVGVDNDCDIIKIDGSIIKSLIGYLYESKDKQYIYNFNWIDADVLGEVYEQYLGKILQQTKSGKSKLKDGQAHKKEQGIYYTPTYIVDYIIKNTILELLKDKKIKPREIKILDSACGSGSFLIKAFDCLYENIFKKEDTEQRKFDSQGVYSVKTEILKKNLYGVDLDNKAVEITKLNLLLKASEKDRKLPKEVDLHIRHGNSLIDDESIDKYAFDWKGDFQEGTFDVIIGNPPYGAELIDSEREFLLNHYPATKNNSDTAIAFINKNYNLLKEGGYLGLIVPKPLIYSQKWIACRDFIKDDLISIVDVSKAFKDVLLEQVIIILRKGINTKNYLIEFIDSKKKSVKVDKKVIDKFGNFINNVSLDELNLSLKLNKGKYISDIATINRGLIIQGMLKEKGKIPILRGKNIGRFLIKPIKEFITEEDYDKIKEQADYMLKPKIIIQNIVAHVTKPQDHIILMSALDEKGLICLDNVGCIFLNDKKINNLFLVSLLNSTLMSWYAYRFIYAKAIRTMRLDKYHISKMPLCDYVGKSEYSEIIKLTEKMISLNKRLLEIGDKTTSETKSLNDKINVLNKEINEEVYKLYRISKEEKEII